MSVLQDEIIVHSFRTDVLFVQHTFNTLLSVVSNLYKGNWKGFYRERCQELDLSRGEAQAIEGPLEMRNAV